MSDAINSNNTNTQNTQYALAEFQALSSSLNDDFEATEKQVQAALDKLQDIEKEVKKILQELMALMGSMQPGAAVPVGTITAIIADLDRAMNQITEVQSDIRADLLKLQAMADTQGTINVETGTTADKSMMQESILQGEKTLTSVINETEKNTEDLKKLLDEIKGELQKIGETKEPLTQAEINQFSNLLNQLVESANQQTSPDHSQHSPASLAS